MLDSSEFQGYIANLHADQKLTIKDDMKIVQEMKNILNK